MNCIQASWHLCRINNFRRSEHGHVQIVRHSFDVSEETHASVGPVDLCYESSMETDHNGQREHDSFQFAASHSLALHIAVAILNHHRKFGLVLVRSKIPRATFVVRQSFDVHASSEGFFSGKGKADHRILAVHDRIANQMVVDFERPYGPQQT